MITSIKNKDYSDLFKRASKELLELDAKNKLVDNPLTDLERDYLSGAEDPDGIPYPGQFTTLEQYFTRLKTLVTFSEDPWQYLMLPLPGDDEPPFEVDANSRSITVPLNFKKNGISVQGDVIAENLYFCIDRYFDAMDLLETNAYVQWIMPDKKTERAAIVPYVDYKTKHEEGKLILLWPLTNEVTEQDGDLTFSLRFMKMDGDKVVYSWNSQPCTVKIVKALQPDMTKYGGNYDDANPLFAAAIADSVHTAEGDNVSAPRFDVEGASYGFDLPHAPYAYLLAEGDGYVPANGLKVTAQACIDDQGQLAYTWDYTNGKVTATHKNSEIFKTEFKETEDIEENPNKIYYVENASAPLGYEICIFDTAKSQEKKIYERNVACYIQPNKGPVADSDVVTGDYKLTAIHRVGFDSQVKELNFTIPGPKVLEFVEDLPESGTIITVDEDGNRSVELKVKTKNDAAPAEAYQLMTYDWRRNPNEAADGDDMETIKIDGDDAIHTGKNPARNIEDSLVLTGDDAVPGWYQVGVTSMLNRDDISINSTICKVTDFPEPPVLKFPFIEDPDGTNGGTKVINAVGKTVTLVIEHEPFTDPTPLYTEGLIYQWFDDNTTLIEDGGAFSGATTGSLVIDGTQFADDTALTLSCRVFNTLNGEQSEGADSGYFFVKCGKQA